MIYMMYCSVEKASCGEMGIIVIIAVGIIVKGRKRNESLPMLMLVLVLLSAGRGVKGHIPVC